MQFRSNLPALYVLIGLMIMSMNACAEQKRIKPKRVTIKNHEQFMAQFKRDFPVGTPIQEVMDYLANNQIEHSYIAPGSLRPYPVPTDVAMDGYDHRVGYVGYILRKISTVFFIFRTDLQVNVYFSEEEKVIDIRHRLVGTGP